MSADQAIKDYIYFWKQIIDDDLNYRMSGFDQVWAQGEEYLQDEGGGKRRGNLVKEFSDSLHSRLLTKDWDLRVESLDPEHMEFASDFKKLASNLSKAVSLADRVKKASSQAMWSGTAFCYVGHPLDENSLFPDKRMDAPDSTNGMGDVTPDDLVEVPPEEVEAYLGENPQVPLMPPGMESRVRKEEPQTPLDVDFGLPWVVNLHPCQVVLPKGIYSLEEADYVAVLHFLTTQELVHMGFQVEEGKIDGTCKSLFERVLDRKYEFVQDIRCVVEVFVKRDRMNPRYSWYHFAYMSDDERQVLFARPNKYGKFIPISALKLEFQKKMWGTTLANQLSIYADMMDVTLQAVMNRIEREAYLKWSETQNSGLSKTDRENLVNPRYQGTIKMMDHASVKLMESSLEDDLFRAVMFLRSSAQATSGQSDLDRGQAIKSISARQTDVLVQASGVNVLSISNQISNFIKNLLFRLLYLVTRHGAVGRLKNYNIGRLAVVFNRGSQDVTSSLLYEVHIRDIGQDPTVEQQLSFNQMLRTLGSSEIGGQISQRLSLDWLTSSLLSVYGYGSEGMSQTEPAPMGLGLPGIPMGQPGLSGPGGFPLDGGIPPALQEMVTGQHPERGPGDRGGVSTANLKQGMLNLGGGTGEG